MPYSSKSQQRYLESSASPLTQDQKEEFRASTDFKGLPPKVKPAPNRLLGYQPLKRKRQAAIAISEKMKKFKK